MASPDGDHAAAGNAGRAALWLASPAGGYAVRAALREMRLPDAFDTDLEARVIHAAELMDARGEEIEEVGAWCRRALRWRALDLFRSPGSRPHTAVHADDGADDGLATLPTVAPDEIEQVVVDVDVAALRRNLGARWAATRPWQLSAALTYLMISLDDGVAVADCPAPHAGADELDRAHWAGLHYAGISDCFARDGEADTPAMRQRRKRRIDEVRRLLADAYAATQESTDV